MLSKPKYAIPAGVMISYAFCLPGQGDPMFTSKDAVRSPARAMHLVTQAVPQKSSVDW